MQGLSSVGQQTTIVLPHSVIDGDLQEFEMMNIFKIAVKNIRNAKC